MNAFWRKFLGRPKLSRVLILLFAVALLACAAIAYLVGMPGKNYTGPLPPLTEEQRALAEEIRRDITHLSEEIGERNMLNYQGLLKSERFITDSFTSAGYQVLRQEYEFEGKTVCNLETEIKGSEHADEIVIVGAHYDTVEGCYGANDNASGCAALLALARGMSGKPCARTLRFVAFVNEEPGAFQSEGMGSMVYARRCRERNENIVAMLSLETMGYFSDQPGSQEYPIPALSKIYGTRGNYIAFVGNTKSRSLVREAVAAFRKKAQFPSNGAALPESVPGAGWSDHWSFWKNGYPGLMVTDTAPFRYPYYHTAADTVDKVDVEKLARVTDGLLGVVQELVR